MNVNHLRKEEDDDFQRYVEKLPNPGEIVFFDRSWYNRAVVEPVMGFCTAEHYERFMHQVVAFERLLVVAVDDSGDGADLGHLFAQEFLCKTWNSRNSTPPAYTVRAA